MTSGESTCWTVVRGAAAGDAAQCAEFVRRYEPVVRAYLGARWRGGPLAQETDDAAQEVFLDCLAPGGAVARADPARPGGFRAFLFGVARNVALRVERRRARDRLRPGAGAVDPDEVVADATSPSAAFDRAWARAILREAAARQREAARTAGPAALRRVELLALRFEQGLPIRDIAARWGEAPRHVHHEYERARDEYRAALREVVAFRVPGTPGEVERECARLLALFG